MSRPLDPVIQAVSGGEGPRIHIADIENLAGTGWLSTQLVSQVHDLYFESVDVAAGDLVIIAAGPQNRQAVYQGWHNAAYQFRKGESGADLALVDTVAAIENLQMFSHIFLASGDGDMAPVATRAVELGIGLTVVTHRGQKSWKLNPFASISLTNSKGGKGK